MSDGGQQNGRAAISVEREREKSQTTATYVANDNGEKNW